MKRAVLLWIVMLLLLSCAKSDKDNKVDEEQEMQMYEPSEMALLMRQMYEFNKATKTRIVNNDSLLSFPEEFENIHKAIMTDPGDRDSEFDSLAVKFVNFQKAAFSTKSDSTAYYFNQSVNSCIACHQTRCTGPIPKIKRLLIN